MTISSLHILIVDDRPPARAGLRALLTSLSSQANEVTLQVIAEARDGKEALQMVEQLHPEVVIMDVRMPIMNGLEATRKIKARWPETRIIILTLYDTHRPEALAAGADVFLLKGCSSNDLYDAIIKGVSINGQLSRGDGHVIQ